MDFAPPALFFVADHRCQSPFGLPSPPHALASPLPANAPRFCRKISSARYRGPPLARRSQGVAHTPRPRISAHHPTLRNRCHRRRPHRRCHPADSFRTASRSHQHLARDFQQRTRLRDRVPAGSVRSTRRLGSPVHPDPHRRFATDGFVRQSDRPARQSFPIGNRCDQILRDQPGGFTRSSRGRIRRTPPARRSRRCRGFEWLQHQRPCRTSQATRPSDVRRRCGILPNLFPRSGKSRTKHHRNPRARHLLVRPLPPHDIPHGNHQCRFR